MEQSSPQPQGLPAEPLKPTPDDAHDSSVVTSRPQTDGTLTDQSQPLSHPSEDATEISGDQPEYITGLKLLTVIVSVTLVVFLLLLDVSILNTVSALQRSTLLPFHLHSLILRRAMSPTSGHPEHYQRFPFPLRRRLVWRSLSVGKVRAAYPNYIYLHRGTVYRDDQVEASGARRVLTSNPKSACLQPLTGKFYSHFNVKVSMSLAVWIIIPKLT